MTCHSDPRQIEILYLANRRHPSRDMSASANHFEVLSEHPCLNFRMKAQMVQKVAQKVWEIVEEARLLGYMICNGSHQRRLLRIPWSLPSESQESPPRTAVEPSRCLHHGEGAREHNRRVRRHLHQSYGTRIVSQVLGTWVVEVSYVFSSLFTIHFLRSGASSSENSIFVKTVTLCLRFARGDFAMKIKESLLLLHGVCLG